MSLSQNMTFINNTYWSVANGADIEFPMDRTFAQWQYVPVVLVFEIASALHSPPSCVSMDRAAGKDLDSVVANPQFLNPQDYSTRSLL